MENTKAQLLSDLFKETFTAANSFGKTNDAIIEILKKGDGAITKDFAFQTAYKTILAMAASTCYDARNEAAVMRCKDICRNVLGCKPRLSAAAKRAAIYARMAVYRRDAERIEEALERNGDEMAEDLFVASALCEHRTLQQTFTGACIKLVFDSGKYDFSAMGDNEPWRLPTI